MFVSYVLFLCFLFSFFGAAKISHIHWIGFGSIFQHCSSDLFRVWWCIASCVFFWHEVFIFISYSNSFLPFPLYWGQGKRDILFFYTSSPSSCNGLFPLNPFLPALRFSTTKPYGSIWEFLFFFSFLYNIPILYFILPSINIILYRGVLERTDRTIFIQSSFWCGEAYFI